MTAILSNMHGDTIRTGVLCQPGHGSWIRFNKATMGVNFVTVSSLSQSCNMVNIHS
jgi:hypothetical protein